MSEPFAGRGIAILGPFPPRPGGVSAQCDILANALTQAGARVTRINSDVPGLRRFGRLGRLLLPVAQIPSLLWQIWRTRQHWQILHVHAASWWGFMPAVVGLAARRWSKRLVVTYHGGEAAQFLARWARLAQPVLRRYDRLLTLTPTQARIFSDYALSSEVVPNIVTLEPFTFRLRGPAIPRLLWLRQLEPRYRPTDALQVFARVKEVYPEAALTIAGGGTLAVELRAQVEKQNLVGVTFSGHLQTDAIPAAYDHADIFLNTSAIDNLPLTLIEASASGLPIVSTNAGAIPDLINNGANGLLAPTGDVEALADAVLNLLADPDLTRRLSLAARENAERFAWEQVAPRLAAAYGLCDSDWFNLRD